MQLSVKNAKLRLKSANFGEIFKSGKRLLELLYKNVKFPAQTEKGLANDKPYFLKPSKKKMLPFLRGILKRHI